MYQLTCLRAHHRNKVLPLGGAIHPTSNHFNEPEKDRNYITLQNYMNDRNQALRKYVTVHSSMRGTFKYSLTHDKLYTTLCWYAEAMTSDSIFNFLIIANDHGLH
jgi:hypothetical protein